MEAIGHQFSMLTSEVADVLAQYMETKNISESILARAAHDQPAWCLDHQNAIAARCLDKVSLENLNPVSDVKAALRDNRIPTLTTTDNLPRVIVYEKRTWRRWIDGLKWPFSKSRTDRNGGKYSIYHGAKANGYLSEHCAIKFSSSCPRFDPDEKIKVTCTMDEYGVVYYLDHHEGHVRCRFPAITC